MVSVQRDTKPSMTFWPGFHSRHSASMSVTPYSEKAGTPNLDAE